MTISLLSAYLNICGRISPDRCRGGCSQLRMSAPTDLNDSVRRCTTAAIVFRTLMAQISETLWVTNESFILYVRDLRMPRGQGERNVPKQLPGY
jgi:hypothetical protein